MTANSKFRNFCSALFCAQSLLMLATILAILIANGNYFETYKEFFRQPLFSLDFIGLPAASLKFIIDDFLMVIFFILVGSELKKEGKVGELSSKEKMLFPVIAAFGGVIMPAILFSLINHDHPENMRGFAIPTATDIAFTYAIIKAFGDRIPNALKIFIVTLAVADDLVAIVIIALFYSKDLQFFYLFLAFYAAFLLYYMICQNVKNIPAYLFIGAFLWFFTLKSGIHPTLSRRFLAFLILYKINKEDVLMKIDYALTKPVNFLILPLFAFANAGVEIKNFSLAMLLDPLIFGIAFGLFIGKQIGITATSYALVKLKLCPMLDKTNWIQFYGVAILAGIGFTMSLFVGNLAFTQDDILNKVRIGVMGGSLISVVAGSLFLLIVTKKNHAQKR